MTRFGKTRTARKDGWPLGDSLMLRAPVVQAALGTCDGPRLAAAVSRAGALGCLTIHATPSLSDAAVRRRLEKIRFLTPCPVLIAFTAQWQRDSLLETCLDAGFRHFQVFWWNGPRLTRLIQGAGGTVFWQVGTHEQVTDALEVGANILVAQGTEAGGPVRSPHPLRDLIAMLLTESKGQLPIVAGGGLADACDVKTVLSWGASAALLGTRFLLSEEAQAAPYFKARLLRAETNDLILDTRLVGDWPCAPRRRLHTDFDDDVPALFAGRGVSRIHQILPAGEIVRRLTPAAS